MIIDCYDIETEPIISLKDFYGEQKHIVDVCLIIFSQEIHTHLLCTYECEEIAHFTVCNGNIPIYRMNYKGTDIAFYLTAIGSALRLYDGQTGCITTQCSDGLSVSVTARKNMIIAE